jgi:hypothetical protein
MAQDRPNTDIISYNVVPGVARWHPGARYLACDIVGGPMSAPVSRLIYHPRWECRRFGETTVHFDSTVGNQDPYGWTDAFLHSNCHITQLRAEVGDVNLWVSGDRFPGFSALYCDRVFVVEGKFQWAAANDLSRRDPVVDSDQAWADHSRWHAQHPFRRRTRFTLKADPLLSFQPQQADGGLVDIAPLLEEHGVGLGRLRAGMRVGTGSQPTTVPDAAGEAIVKALDGAPVVLRDPGLHAIRRVTPDLESPGASGQAGPGHPAPQGSWEYRNRQLGPCRPFTSPTVRRKDHRCSRLSGRSRRWWMRGAIPGERRSAKSQEHCKQGSRVRSRWEEDH